MTRLLSFFVAVAFVVGGAFGAWWLYRSGPTVETSDRAPRKREVRVVPLTPGSQSVHVTAYGTVVPVRQVEIRPEVTGRVLRVHPNLTAGGVLAEGDELIALDDTDYQLALRERRAELTEAKVEVTLEGGRRTVARREWETFSDELDAGIRDASLALREPQRDLVRARLYRARARVDQARTAVERTKLSVPFPAMVLQETTEFGMLANASSPICTLVGTDSFYVEAALPMADLQRSNLHSGRKARAIVRLAVGAGGDVTWEGRVVRVLGALSERSRMARVVVEVPDPLDLKSPEGRRKLPLLLDSFVEVRIDAGRLDRVVEIPRSALREGNTLWLVDHNDQIQILEADVRWRRAETVLVTHQFMRDQRLVVSDLRAPLPGMAVTPVPVEPEAPRR